jgi:hypothetical protein
VALPFYGALLTLAATGKKYESGLHGGCALKGTTLFLGAINSLGFIRGGFCQRLLGLRSNH